jgi:hypothetical protein
MPCVSRFYGIAKYQYAGDHNPPHFHAKYGGQDAAIDIRTTDVIVGELSGRALALVREWGGLHRAELAANWELLAKGQSPNWIDPLP